MQPRHPLSLGFLPQLPLEAHCHMASPAGSLGGRGDHANPVQDAYGSSLDSTGGHKLAVPRPSDTQPQFEVGEEAVVLSRILELALWPS